MHAGYRVGVVGRNGTGKSSLFAAIRNEIEADKSGTVTKVMCDNGQAVEYGQALFVIE